LAADIYFADRLINQYIFFGSTSKLSIIVVVVVVVGDFTFPQEIVYTSHLVIYFVKLH